jgi:hypothetical protein
MRYEIRGNGSVSFANQINHLPDPPEGFGLLWLSFSAAIDFQQHSQIDPNLHGCP